MTTLEVITCGPGTSFQDMGRIGYQKFGVSPSGAADKAGLIIANALVGNADGVAAIEFVLMGGQFKLAGGPVRIALAGADASLRVDDAAIAPLTSATVQDGQTVTIGPARSGTFFYLAVSGGLHVPPALGSLSLHGRTGIGGFQGRVLQAGDQIPLHSVAISGAEQHVAAPFVHESGPLRVMLGPQAGNFTEAGIATFLSAPYTISANADRMGFRLVGENIEHNAKGYNIVSDGIASGGIQVPGNGQPIILLADKQTTGGYPKIATVISADLARLAQMRPGGVIQFTSVTRESALDALRQYHAGIEAARASITPVTAAVLDSSALLALNLVGGWVSAEP
ncbi:MAG: biotin-dependent carboxyltransferase family protein [Beijerinckiaceae bacterium]